MSRVLGNGYEAFGRSRENGETEKMLVHNIGTVPAKIWRLPFIPYLSVRRGYK